MERRQYTERELIALGASPAQLTTYAAFGMLRGGSGDDDARLPAHEWKVLREAVFARDNYICAYCGERGGKLECDHVEPLALGGSNEMDNLVTACKPCNRSKGAKTLAEWRSQ